jgi:hypothetical protein
VAVGKRKWGRRSLGFIGAGGRGGARRERGAVERGDMTLVRCSRGAGETDRWAWALHSAISLII